ncbi:uncharacterized protein LACBIDRAFT_307136 [Laccaria bicolor S238N-H82]|uniref:Predicted protein n=1 Tax=Laccaria bicolor (strain S238N-H82 / ATCC MYA-4686) TaxID=486041 RepID=B0DPF6_LACBS|nr:uncharacterized protein LACBIDRAFT_307136 [Laccaria bicolor S238N-H82]EDR03442.1 predicted protein [Laccaria bicolor S238N-H82]|eukprot:XP_001885898.1 predicted protein [Laccaria bicolor S238N-H82]
MPLRLSQTSIFCGWLRLGMVTKYPNFQIDIFWENVPHILKPIFAKKIFSSFQGAAIDSVHHPSV